MPSDAELLRRYVENGSQEAFGELVRRHLSLVYHSALRRVGRNAHAADDVTQAVFTGLARKARTLQHHPNLAGWLYTATRFAAADSVRAERRRRAHEQEAETMEKLNAEPPIPSERLEPFLDEALDLMDQHDREAVLLHYFEGHTFAEVGAALSLSADAARMRVSRALERLRVEFARRGVASSAAAVTTALTAQTTMSAAVPSALAVAGRALSQAGAAQAASWGARILGGAKLAVSGWMPAALILGAGALSGAWIGLREMAWKAPDPASTAAPPAGAAEEITVQAEPAVVPSPGAPHSVRAAPVSTGAYEALSTSEQVLLARLLYLHENPPSSSGAWVLKIGGSAPAADGIAPALAQGLIDQGPHGGVTLTAAGIAYCEQNAGLVRASPFY
ncbi:MAG TPA: sigma-70 family RNA polymerase sigma factor, partial [Opitutaceae bacterium]|nr:sigma-70 family RNA polymerase sigma factor [Opitutaceae bacterium]